MFMLPSRQVHLDFHTTEHINGIGKDFDPNEFAKMAKEASINSMTVFARCHHGWLYYPSEKFPELIHPHLKRPNLLVEQVEALHKEGIKAPVYITVQWDYHSATTKPEWLIRKENGAHESSSFNEPGFYQSLCVNTKYIEFLREQTLEVIQLLGDKLDGIFFDIVGIRDCWCASCRKEMKEKGIDASDEIEVNKFSKFVMDRFKLEMTEFIRGYNKDCTIFYNAGHVGPCTKNSEKAYSHFELESLPSGSWGYLHFPVAARYGRTLGKDCLGMTGKFHTEWGDFHSLKNLAALEFECFRMLSYGFASSIGDQMEPTGILNPATYKLIGKVYSQIKQFEDWARPSIPVVEAAIVTSESDNREFITPESIFGATQMFEELSLQFDIIDFDSSFEKYKLIILVDDLIVNEDFQSKIDAYVANGGKVIATGKGGLNKDKNFPKSFGINYVEESKEYPDFIIADGELSNELEVGNEYVIYEQGNSITLNGAKALLSARKPYFKREGDKFISHRYTPSAKGEAYPVATLNNNVIYFSHPMFTQYRLNAPNWCKKIMSNAINMLLSKKLVKHNGPSTLSVQLLDQPEKNRMVLHILTYIPVRKSKTIDIIEERTVVNNVEFELNLDKQIKSVKTISDKKDIVIDGNKINVHQINGYEIVEINY